MSATRTTDEPTANRVVAACRRIETSTPLPAVSELAAEAGVSRRHFQRLFKQQTGVSPHAYLDAVRWQRARRVLASAGSVTEAVYEAGFESSGSFYAQSTPRLGMRPSRLRERGRGETIRFALGECSLGSVLVAHSEHGVCAILLGDAPEPLLHELQERFAHAHLIGDDGAYQSLVAQVVGLIENPGSRPALPLDIRGTAFQQAVWQALQRIPAGRTVSYAEVARRIGRPQAARAVARACADNRLAVAIPCHRVVRGDGAPGGYRWGLLRKCALLQREADAAAGPA